MSTDMPPFHDVRVRRAISHAISWSLYVKNYGPNIPFDYGSRIAAVWLER